MGQYETAMLEPEIQARSGAQMTASREVLMAAGQIREKVTELVLEWGRLVNDAEANPDDLEKKKKANEAGRTVQLWGMGLAKRFG